MASRVSDKVTHRVVIIKRIEVVEETNETVVEAATIEEAEVDMMVHEVAAAVAVLEMIAIEVARIMVGAVSKQNIEETEVVEVAITEEVLEIVAEVAVVAEVALVAPVVSTKASTEIHLNRQVYVFKYYLIYNNKNT